MEELQDAIEDAQYVNAINTQEDGPRPVLAWEKPATPELMEAWASKKKWDLDSVLESAIGFFLFSSFLKTKRDDYVRINFCEDVIRFKKYRGRTRRKQAEYIMEQYLDVKNPRSGVSSSSSRPKQSNVSSGVSDTHSSLLKEVDNSDFSSEANDVGMSTQNSKKLPPRTEIEETDLERKVSSSSSKTNAYLKEDKSFGIYCDYPACSQSVVGIRDAVLEDLIDDWKEWEDQERKTAASFQKNMAKYQPSSRQNSSASKATSSGQQQPDQQEPISAVSSSGGSTKQLSLDSNGDTKKPAAMEEQAPDPAAESGGDASVLPAGADSESSEKVTPAPVEEKKEYLKKVSGISVEEYNEITSSMKLLTQKFKTEKDALKDALFDKAETIVMESLRRDYWKDFLQSEEFSKVRNFLWYQDRPTVPEDFYIMRVLGRGGFGLVNGKVICSYGFVSFIDFSSNHSVFVVCPFTACKKGTSGKLYAMKMMNKRRIKMKKSEQLAMNERSAMAAVESNFVVNLKYSFHSKEDVYLILDLMTGGDLGFHLHQKGRFPKREVQYYAARIMLGLQALHDKGYVYRDLKPENCLMGDDGRVKITDLGLATKITPTLHGAAGTRGYWAPEMLRRDKRGKRMPYGHTVDWFSFGCCVTEFICGANPFRSEAALNFGLAKGKQTKEKAIDCATLEMQPEFPREFFDPDARDLCQRLLEKDETTRLGTNGCEEIMAHPYFKNVHWESIISDRKRPPFVPAKDVNAASQSEIGNFVEDKTYQETVLDERDDTFYRNWAWTNPRAYSTEVIEFLIYERETGEPLLPIAQNAGCCCVIL